VLADLAADIEAADSGQHDIEKKQRRLRHGGLGNDGSPGEKCGDLVTGGSQVVFDQARHIRIVFHYVDQIGVTRFVYCLQWIHDRKESLTRSRSAWLRKSRQPLKGRLISKILQQR